MSGLSFSYPWLLFLLIAIPFLVWFIIRKDKKRYASVRFSDFTQISSLKPSWRVRLRLLPDCLRVLAIALLIVACARPHYSLSKHNRDIMGIDIVIDLDVSPSMLADDFKPTRIECAKKVAGEFISGRSSDEIGLVVFSGEAFTQCPPTVDHGVLGELLSKCEVGQLADGTAIGDGLAVSVNRIKDSKAKSKTIILITDGVNNSGQVDPESAALFAKKYGIRVYTIGIGSNGKATISIATPQGVQKQEISAEIDEVLLKKIAKQTGGKYFRVTKDSTLKDVFEEIDKLEKTIIKVSSYQQNNDVGYVLVYWVIFIVLLECILRYGVIRIKY